MSATLLMMGHVNKINIKTKVEEKKDNGTCFNCIRQGTGSTECNTCKRALQWHYYKAPKNLINKFKIED